MLWTPVINFLAAVVVNSDVLEQYYWVTQLHKADFSQSGLEKASLPSDSMWVSMLGTVLVLKLQVLCLLLLHKMKLESSTY